MNPVHSVTFVGENNKQETALFFGPADAAVGDLLVLDENGTGRWERDVPRREFPSEEGNGRTFH